MSQMFEESSILKIQAFRIAGERRLVVRVKMQCEQQAPGGLLVEQCSISPSNC